MVQEYILRQTGLERRWTTQQDHVHFHQWSTITDE